MKAAVKKKDWPKPSVPHPASPARLDAAGHVLFRFMQRWSDLLPAHIESMPAVEAYVRFALRDAAFISRESRKLTTWRILDKVLISVDESGTVTTVHPRVDGLP